MPKPDPSVAAKPERKRSHAGKTGAVHQRPYKTLTVPLVIEALRQSAGIQAVAAEKLRVHRSTITHFVQDHPEVADAKREITEELADLAEGKLLEGIRKGEFPAIKFFLESQARDRGYGRAVELSGPRGGPIETKLDGVDLNKLSVAQLRELEALLTAAATGGGADDAADS